MVCFHFFHLFLVSWKFLAPLDSNFSRNLINIKKASLENSSIKKKEAKKLYLRMKEISKRVLQKVMPDGAYLQQFAQSKGHFSTFL